MFSNSKYYLKIIVTAALLVLLGFHSFWKGPELNGSYEKCLSDPETFDGARVAMLYVTVLETTSWGMRVRVADAPIAVRSPEGTGAPGDSVSIDGIFRKDGFVDATEVHVHKGRQAKRVVSAIAAVVVVAFFLRFFSLNWEQGRLIFRARASERIVRGGEDDA